MDKGYTTEAKIAKYLNATIASGDASDFILAAQSLIEKYTARNFKADTTASIKLYNGNDRQDLIIDDCVEVTKVEVGNNFWGDIFINLSNEEGQTPEYYLLPNNYASDGVPIRKIGLRNRVWMRGQANQRITARWGFSEEVPDDISFVATVLASGMYYQNRGENTGAVKSERIGEYQVSYSEQGGFNDMQRAMAILDTYKKIQL